MNKQIKNKKNKKKQTCFHRMQAPTKKYFRTDLKNRFQIPSP